MEMQTLTPMILRELIDKIEVHQIKERERIEHRLDTRQGVAVSYQVAAS